MLYIYGNIFTINIYIYTPVMLAYIYIYAIHGSVMGREPTWQLRVLDEHLCSSQIFAARTVHFSSISVYMGQGGSGAGHGVAMVWPMA